MIEEGGKEADMEETDKGRERRQVQHAERIPARKRDREKASAEKRKERRDLGEPRVRKDKERSQDKEGREVRESWKTERDSIAIKAPCP